MVMTITYDVLTRNTDEFKVKLLKYSGKVLQIQPVSDSLASVYRIAIDSNSDNVIWAQTSAKGKSILDSIIENDIVDVYCMVYEKTSYSAVFGKYDLPSRCLCNKT